MPDSPHRSPRRKVLVLGHGTLAFLSVIRSLGRAGIEVHVAWFEDGEAALRSRYVAKAHRIPTYRPHEDAWRAALGDLMRRERFDLVIPCDEERGLPLAAHRSELERWGRIALPAPEALEALQSKFETTRLARSLGLPVPREVIVSALADAEAVPDGFLPPLILKPPHSFRLDDLERRRKVQRADSWEELDLLLEEMLADGPVAVQEFCPGVGVGVELLLREGAPLMAFQHVRLHEPLRGGGSAYRRSAAVAPDLLDCALELLATLRYTGVAMAEFKRETDGGRWVLLEVNPRFWGSLPLALAAGADFPLALYRLLVEGRSDVDRGYRVGLCARNLTADAWWHLENRRADRSDPTLNSRPWPSVARETSVNLLTGRERNDSFTVDDPRPGLAEVGGLARALARTARLRAQLRVGGRRRRRLGATARADLRDAARVLFVCQGNIARSPFAAAIARRRSRDGQEFRSAGILQPGRRSPGAAVAAAARWEVDLTEHRSRAVSRELVRESDVIFVFDYRNFAHMVRHFPEARGRLHPFGALDGAGPLFVSDPWGLGAEVYDATFRRIAETLSPR